VRSDLQVCPQCGPRPESGAAFCSECGRPLTAASVT
jgi:predicted amidophosphoribosyltransferase